MFFNIIPHMKTKSYEPAYSPEWIRALVWEAHLHIDFLSTVKNRIFKIIQPAQAPDLAGIGFWKIFDNHASWNGWWDTSPEDAYVLDVLQDTHDQLLSHLEATIVQSSPDKDMISLLIWQTITDNPELTPDDISKHQLIKQSEESWPNYWKALVNLLPRRS